VRTCSSDPVLVANLATAARLASPDPSVANNTFVGKMLMILSVLLDPLIMPQGLSGLYGVDALTTSTGQWACAAMLLETLPIGRLKRPMPLLPTTIVSTPISSPSATTSASGSPVLR
jgi:hypothetical protein